MRIERATSSYNQRRYSKPWIAKVDFSKNPNGDFSWGNWVGDHYNGSDGLLVIDANPGDIIATGQKDFRQPKNSAPDWWIIAPNGQLIYIEEGKSGAYKAAMEVAHDA